MTKTQIYKYLSITAFAAALMLAVSIFNQGITAQNFELVSGIETYTNNILAAERPLRMILTFDNLFLTFYTAAFVFLAMAVRDEKNELLVNISHGLTPEQNIALLQKVAKALNPGGFAVILEQFDSNLPRPMFRARSTTFWD